MKNFLIAVLAAPCLAGAAMLDRQAVLEQRAEASFAYTVEKAKRHDRALGAAELFHAAFYFCETGRHLDQLDILFGVAAEMQDRDPSVRDRAERLLKLFYTDICASSFAPAGRLAGTHSRDYDYLYGMGGVAALLRAIGVAAPRFIVSFWGEDDDSYRTLWVGRHIALGDTPLKPTRGRPFAHPLQPGDCVFVQHGSGACAVRVAWSRGIAGDSAPAVVVWDDPPDVNAFRLTVAHHDFWGRPMDTTNPPSAAFWVRVTDNASTPEKFAAFRAAFKSATCSVHATSTNIALKASGEDGPLTLGADSPFAAASCVEPAPKRAIFAVNGRDIGAEIVGEAPGIAEYRAERARVIKALAANRIPVTTRRAATWEAESGAIEPSLRADADPGAVGGKFVWLPGEVGGKRSGRGQVSWQLDVHAAGTYHL